MSAPGYAAAQAVVDLLATRPARLGSGRLVCLDGPAGSGKTTLADRLLERVPGSRVVHLDDLLEGWDGLPRVDVQLEALLEPLGRGLAGCYRRWDWHADRWAEEVVVEPVPLLVLEGVGSGSLVTARWTSVLAWVEAPHDLRMRRGIERDGEAFAPHWESWAAAETEHFARHRTRERADLVLDGSR